MSINTFSQPTTVETDGTTLSGTGTLEDPLALTGVDADGKTLATVDDAFLMTLLFG